MVEGAGVVISPTGARGAGGGWVSCSTSGAAAGRGTLVLVDPGTRVPVLLDEVVVVGGPSGVLGGFCGGGGRIVADLPVLHTLG